MLTRTGEIVQPISLAHVAPFRLGAVDVHPATRQLIRSDASETVEPRVMQVLVALARAEGGVVTREELTDLCWDGRIVSENAINRVISRLRQTAAEFGEGSFQLETITKVGYRLSVHQRVARGGVDGEPSSPTPRSREEPTATSGPISRRLMLGGASVLTAAAAVVVGGYWFSPAQTGRGPASSAAQLYRKGADARADGSINMVGQAEAYFSQAVEADPKYAEAWAALALARAGQVAWEQGEAQETMAARARLAARRALELDAGSVEARAALALVPSPFGRWAEAQAEIRQLLQAPNKTPYVEWVLRFRLSELLAEVGRCRDALKAFRPLATILPDHPWSSVGLVQALWMAGEPDAARAESERAIRRFPRRGVAWFMHMALLTYGSRPEDAVAFGSDRAQLPHRETGEGLLFRRTITAKALAELKPDDIAHAARLHRASVAADREEIPPATRFFAALGDLDAVFELLRGYFHNRGGFSDPSRPPPGPLTRYALVDLFWPPMAPVWSDPRFARLAEEIGLAAYWRTSGFVPDFRRRGVT